MTRLTPQQEDAIQRIIALARKHRSRQTETLADGSEVYAYPHGGGGIAWGLNAGDSGLCIIRGIRPDFNLPKK